MINCNNIRKYWRTLYNYFIEKVGVYISRCKVLISWWKLALKYFNFSSVPKKSENCLRPAVPTSILFSTLGARKISLPKHTLFFGTKVELKEKCIETLQVDVAYFFSYYFLSLKLCIQQVTKWMIRRLAVTQLKMKLNINRAAWIWI